MIVSFRIAEKSCWITPPRKMFIAKFDMMTALDALPIAAVAEASD
jgi:hypothetical protein